MISAARGGNPIPTLAENYTIRNLADMNQLMIVEEALPAMMPGFLQYCKDLIKTGLQSLLLHSKHTAQVGKILPIAAAALPQMSVEVVVTLEDD
jgi:hypothetical protein